MVYVTKHLFKEISDFFWVLTVLVASFPIFHYH